MSLRVSKGMCGTLLEVGTLHGGHSTPGFRVFAVGKMPWTHEPGR